MLHFKQKTNTCFSEPRTLTLYFNKCTGILLNVTTQYATEIIEAYSDNSLPLCLE